MWNEKEFLLLRAYTPKNAFFDIEGLCFKFSILNAAK